MKLTPIEEDRLMVFLAARALRATDHTTGTGTAGATISLAFVSQAASESFAHSVGTRRRIAGVHGTRTVTKDHMAHNARNPRVDVNVELGQLTVDGAAVPPMPESELPLNRNYFIV
jgi:urease subunit alpha